MIVRQAQYLCFQGGSKKIKVCRLCCLVKDDDKWWPQNQNLSADEVHNHASDRGAVLSDLMKKDM